MVTRNLKCFECDLEIERTAIGMAEPSTVCPRCKGSMERQANAVQGFKLRGPGFHSVDYPKDNATKMRDYGLESHDSTDPDSDYNQDGYADEMVSNAPSVKAAKDVAARFDKK